MSVLVNLLPDLRQAKLRAKQRRQLAIGISIGLWVTCGVLVGVLVLYTAGQKVIISSLSKSINEKKEELKNIPDIEAALTAQAHSASLTDLYGRRVYLTRFFSAYEASSPTDVVIGTLTVDAQNALAVSGTARNYAAAAKLARSLQAAKSDATDGDNAPYFTDVNITTTERSDTTNFVSFNLKANLATEVVSGRN